MTVEQEINLLANKYGELALSEAAKNYISKVKNSEEKRQWDAICLHYGFKTEDYGETFSNGRETFTLKSIVPRNRKYPVIAVRADGRSFKFTSSSVLMYMGRRKNI